MSTSGDDMKAAAFSAILPLAAACAAGAAAPAVKAPDDPYLWLEDIEAPKALDWVRARNQKSETLLRADARFGAIEAEVRTILLARDRIPLPNLEDGWVYNFWQDAEHVRGLWRRVRPEEYEKAEPAWETILDLDALAREESENWVWHGASLLPGSERALVFLSRGGKDAHVMREFDVGRRTFVAGGFTLPEAKSRAAWLDADHLLVGTDFGPDSLTKSGYPRRVKRWRRGTPLGEAALVFEGEVGDVSVSAYTSFRPEGRTSFVGRAPSFFEEETYAMDSGGKLTKIPLPRDADFRGVFQGHFLAILRSPWQSFAEGTLVALRPDGAVERVYAPDARSSLRGVVTSKRFLYLTVLENVRGRLLRVGKGPAGWEATRVALPDHGAVDVLSADDFDDRLYVRFESFTVPSRVALVEGVDARPVKRLPERFDASGVDVEQHEAASADGTRIPYFLVRKRGRAPDGQTPTLLTGYGGFEIANVPFYAGALGKVWLERGGALAVANIRGGGEFGPRWHQAALKARRAKAFEDFIAVAEDLMHRKVTSPRRLGISGGSNGGLLVGAVFLRRPELFNAVVCQVPLLDMMRYHRLLAGNSWMAEYGDPDDPGMAPVLLSYSPYHGVRAGVKYPKVFFLTSTKDDRVHPGHARKMAARMEEQGHDVLYYENIEGGHGGAANLEQRVKKTALEYTFLFRQLGD
jgi:prolyl oligopeptidase